MDLRELLAAHMPGYDVGSVAPFGSGLDNTAYLVNDELVVRFPNVVDPDEVVREARLLEMVAAVSPLRVPEPVFVEPGLGCLAYRVPDGVPLIGCSSVSGVGVADQLGAFLSSLHSAEGFEAVASEDVVPLGEWVEEARESYAVVRAQVPVRYHDAIEHFLTDEPPAATGALVFSHNDLGIEHVLVDPDTSRVTGIIDWSDAALVDPAYDFGLLYRDLGPEALGAALAQYSCGGEQLVERAQFYARCSVFEDLAFGLETGRVAYQTKSLDSLAWLFPY